MLEVRYHPQVKKEIDRIPPTWRSRIRRVIRELAQHPQKGKRLRGKLEGMRSYRAGNYRIIYTCEKKVLYVLCVRHRSEAYDDAIKRVS